MIGLGGLLFVVGGIFFAFGLLAKFIERLPQQHLSTMQRAYVPPQGVPAARVTPPVQAAPPPVTHLGVNSMATGPQGDF